MANLINMDISSKENLGQPSQKKGSLPLNTREGSNKSPFALTLDKALKNGEKDNLLKAKIASSDMIKSSTSLKEGSKKISKEVKGSNSLNKNGEDFSSKVVKKNQDKGTTEVNTLIFDNNTSPVVKNSSQVNSTFASIETLKPRNIDNDKVIFTSKGKSVEVSIENLRKGSDSLKNSKAQQSLRAQNSFKKEEKTFSIKPDIVMQGDFKLTSVNSTNFSSVAFETAKRDTLNFTSQFWQEWESKIDAQIIDKARIILKDGNSGEIQLKLYPEKLGTVRVSLDVEGTQVLARFILDNSQVREVFEANSAFLQKSLEESGLSVSLNFSSFSEGSSKGSSQDSDELDDNLSLALNNNDVELLEADLSEGAQALIDMII